MSSHTDTGTAADPGQPTYPHVAVRLSGTDGNTFHIIGRVAAALRRQVGDEAAATFSTAAYQCGSRDEVLRLAMTTVDVS
jgi:hypothetical protein